MFRNQKPRNLSLESQEARKNLVWDHFGSVLDHFGAILGNFRINLVPVSFGIILGPFLAASQTTSSPLLKKDPNRENSETKRLEKNANSFHKNAHFKGASGSRGVPLRFGIIFDHFGTILFWDHFGTILGPWDKRKLLHG